MPALNFSVFIEKVKSGEKCQSIRPGHRFKVGDMVYCYEGMRTKKCRKLNQGRVVEVIPIEWVGIFVTDSPQNWEDIARRDGFANSRDMDAWFRAEYKHSFDGQIIRWEPVEETR
jgi:hypothetical protein